MGQKFHIRLQKDGFVFSAAHFITFNGNVCERLHGHNYKVFVELHGPLDENRYVFDFIALRDVLQQITRELDHRVLLPTQHPAISVTADDTSVEARFEDRRWLFPRGDCLLLPVANTTAELLASYIGQRLLDALQQRTGQRPRHLVVGVDENENQWAVCELIDE